MHNVDANLPWTWSPISSGYQPLFAYLISDSWQAPPGIPPPGLLATSVLGWNEGALTDRLLLWEDPLAEGEARTLHSLPAKSPAVPHSALGCFPATSFVNLAASLLPSPG